MEINTMRYADLASQNHKSIKHIVLFGLLLLTPGLAFAETELNRQLPDEPTEIGEVNVDSGNAGGHNNNLWNQRVASYRP